MAYVYLLDFYKYLEERLDDVRADREPADRGPSIGSFAQGRIDALTEFQDFLKDNFNPKLPRRIRESLAPKKSP